MDSDQEFIELRALTELLLANQRENSDLPLVQKLILREQLRYCFYKLTKFNCPKAWTESDRASALLFEMMKPELKFEVPTERIRHRLCSCISEEEINKNKKKVQELADLLQSSKSGFTTVTCEAEKCGTPAEILVVKNTAQNLDSTAQIQQMGEEQQAMSEASDADNSSILQSTTIEELEAATFPELFDSSDEEEENLNLPEVLTDVSVVRTLDDGELPPPKLFGREFIVLAAQARRDNFLCAEESILCDIAIKDRSPRRLRGAASVKADQGQLTLIRPGRKTIMRNFDGAKTFSKFFEDIEDSLIDKQDLFEHLCLYYWFKNVVRNKGVHERHWLECPIVLSRGDNSLQAQSLRAIPLTLGQFCEKMV